MLRATPPERLIIKPILVAFDDNLILLEQFHRTLLGTIENSPALRPFVHSIRARIKDRDHLQDKLVRKMRDCAKKAKPFKITAKNLHTEINDLAGIRILHLHTMQAKEIDKQLKMVFARRGYHLIEGPEARTWDIEYEKFFADMGFQTRRSETLYTSVHYVVCDKVPQLTMTCEIQVRTLTEEVWGEVDHTLNYPHQTTSVACHQQLRALARATSASGRLVDAIYATVDDEEKRKVKASKRAR